MIQLTLLEVHARVNRMVDGGATLAILDPKTGITFVIPFDAKSAREVGNALSSPLHVANGSDIPPNPPEAA